MGCMWQGKLGNISDHLGNCQFEEVKCTKKCEKTMQRRYLTVHIENECPRRQVTCQYCDSTGEHQFIEGEHKEECPRFPIPCPNRCDIQTVPREDMEKHKGECLLEVINCSNNCGQKLERQCLTAHVVMECQRRKVKCQFCNDEVEYQFKSQHNEVCPKFPLPCPNNCKIGTLSREDVETHRKECPLEMIQCEYPSVGCEVRMLRINRHVHEEENANKHLMLTKLKLQSTEDTLANAIQRISALETFMHQNIPQSVHYLVKLFTMATLFESGDQACPVIIKVPKFNQKVNNNVTLYTDSFYTHSKGYKMCVRLDPAGLNDGRGTHLSMFMYVMKGPYDDNLTWPLKGTFDIKLLNQLSDSEHLSVAVTFDDSTRGHGSRVTIGDKAATGWGQRYRFISNENLHKITPTCQFLKDDCVFFEINFHV